MRGVLTVVVEDLTFERTLKLLTEYMQRHKYKKVRAKLIQFILYRFKYLNK